MRLHDVIEAFDALDTPPSADSWNNLGARASADPAELLHSLVDHINAPERAAPIKQLARETPTHYVWPLWRSGRLATGIYINEFKSNITQSTGYARSVHNHRYDFITIPLAGGYRYETWTVTPVAQPNTKAIARLTSEGTLSVRQWLLVDHREYHRLSELAPNTLTLVLKSAPRTASSYSVDLSTGDLVEHVPVEDRLPSLLNRLESCLK